MSRKLGKFTIREKLGRGGMADVYLAQDTERDAQVALKLIEHSADADTCDSIEAERRGAVLQEHLAAIDPAVVKIFESGDLDGYFYVSMEYIEGQDLAELMRRGPLQVEFATDVALAVAGTLEKAHTLHVTIDGKDFQGIVHGDIKPKNIRIDKHGEVRVLDFGIAKALSLSRKLTRNEFGSVPYASPERLDAGEVNVHSDLWSLSVMLYEMVTGMQPYQAESTERLERMIRSRIPPPPPPNPCPEPLRRILIKATAPEPELRYASAGEFAGDLAAFRNGGTVRAVTEDLNATRRTARREAGDETRRTQSGMAVGPDDTRRTSHESQTGMAVPPDSQAGVPVLPSGTAPQAGVSETTRSKLRRWARLAAGGLGLVAVVWAAGVGVSDYFLYRHGQQLQREIEAEQVTDLTDIWNRWTELSKGNSSSVYLRGPRTVVKQKFVAAAGQVIDSYRMSDAVYENNWKSARDLLAHALAVEPDNTVRGELRLCEGHIARINGTSHRSAEELNLAVEKFTEAERLMPHSPDPELGLARVYVYGLKDIDKAYQALQRAEQGGYQLGNREKVQLADGYRDRADRTFWDSRNVRGLPQEKDQVARARDDYQRALQLYQSVAPYGNASAGIARVQASLESVNFRLQQIDAGDSGVLGTTNPTQRMAIPLLRRILRSWL